MKVTFDRREAEELGQSFPNLYKKQQRNPCAEERTKPRIKRLRKEKSSDLPNSRFLSHSTNDIGAR